MELLEVDCGNGVERRLGPLSIPKPTSLNRGMAKVEGNLALPSLSPFFSGSVVWCSNERWLVADCDLCGGGFGCVGRGPVEGRRWIRCVTEGDNLITAFYLLSSSSSTLAGSFALSPTSCRYGNLKPIEKPSAPELATWWSRQRRTHVEGVCFVSAESFTHFKSRLCNFWKRTHGLSSYKRKVESISNKTHHR